MSYCHSYSPYSSFTTTSTIVDDTASFCDDDFTEVPYMRKRPTPPQLQALQRIFTAKPYPTRGDRMTLATDIGMDYKSVTVWFQNKRQSSKRKAWTKSTRAKACIESEENKPHSDFVHDAKVKPQISLDCIASLFERPSHPTIHDNTSKFQPPLTPRKPNNGGRAMSPASGSKLWTHMPSSPPESLSSPSADSFRFAMIHSPSRLMKSLEWACAKAREGRRQNKAKEYRAPPGSLGKVPSMFLEGERKSTRTNPKVASEEEETDTGTESDEAITPSTSMSSMRSSLFLEEIKHETRRKCTESAPEDLEAALVLLGFRK